MVFLIAIQFWLRLFEIETLRQDVSDRRRANLEADNQLVSVDNLRKEVDIRNCYKTVDCQKYFRRLCLLTANELRRYYVKGDKALFNSN